MTSTAVEPGRALGADPFEHLGMLYDDPEDYAAGTTAFVRAALASGDAVLVAVPGPNLDLVRARLGPDGDGVRFADMSVAGRNPGRILPGVLLDFAEAHAGRRVSVIGEPVWAGRSDAEYPACVIHEALINAAFAGRDAAILCPYDTGALDERAVADAHRTHPVMERRGARVPSAEYMDPLALADSFNEPLPCPPPASPSVAYDHCAALAEVRRFITDMATGAGLTRGRAGELAVAVNELATNSLAHTASGGRVTAWVERGALVCRVEDTGHLADPLVGRVMPPTDQPGGRGLLLVNHLCDLVRVHTRPGSTTFHLHVRF